MTLNKEKKIQKQESSNKRWQLWYFNISGGEEQREVWQGAKVSKAGQLVYGHHQRWIAMIILTMTVRGTMVGSEVCMAVCWFMDNGHHQRWIANIILIMMVVHGHHLTVQKRWVNRCNIELDTPIRFTPIMTNVGWCKEVDHSIPIWSRWADNDWYSLQECLIWRPTSWCTEISLLEMFF